MISNITTGSSVFGVLAYNKIKATEGSSGVIFCNKMAYAQRIMENGELPLIAHTLNDYISGAKRAKENLVFHVSLNPHPDDKLDDWELAEISREYMEKMGFGEQPYVVYKHNDIDRPHVHIVASFIDRDGKKVP